MTTLVVLAAGFLIGATRGVFTLSISGFVLAVFTLAINASEGLIRALARCIGWVFVLDAGFILALTTSVLLRNLLSGDSRAKTRRSDAYGGN